MHFQPQIAHSHKNYGDYLCKSYSLQNKEFYFIEEKPYGRLNKVLNQELIDLQKGILETHLKDVKKEKKVKL